MDEMATSPSPKRSGGGACPGRSATPIFIKPPKKPSEMTEEELDAFATDVVRKMRAHFVAQAHARGAADGTHN